MRILVIRPGALGDILLTLPALQALQAGFPAAAIEVLGNLPVLQLLPGRSPVTAVSSFDRADLAVLFQPTAVPTASLQRYLDSFDLILSYATPPTHVFARNLARVARGRVLSFDARPTPEQHVHMSAHLQQPLREWGIAPHPEQPRLTLSAADRQDAAVWWTEHGLAGKCVLAIHPGSGSPAKNWPAERFVAIAQHVARQHPMRIVWLSGPADQGTLLQVQRALGTQDHVWLQDPPLPRLAAVLARCQAYLGNDSGVSHLAAAVGTPAVVIFGPTDPDVWAPRGPHVRVVRGTAPCAPCSPEQRSGCSQRVCLETVSVQRVVEHIDLCLHLHYNSCHRSQLQGEQ